MAGGKRTGAIGRVAGLVSPLILAAFLAGVHPQRAAAAAQEARGKARKLNLLAKNPETWKEVPGGPRGIISYNEKSGRFTVQAHKLKPLTAYALIRHDDRQPGDLVARGTTDGSGRLALAGAWRGWRGKFWIVAAADLAVAEGMATVKEWHPRGYLFEEKVLGIPCECEE